MTIYLYTQVSVVQMIQAEMARLNEAERLRKVTPQQKAELDKQRWIKWLNAYGKRLQQEREAGASAEERVRVMNATNPR